MDKKGFTLVELLGIIVILGVIITIGVTSITGLLNRSNEKLVEEKKTSLEQAGVYYGQENQDMLTRTCTTFEIDEENHPIEDTREEFDFCTLMTLGELLKLNIYDTEDYDENNNKIVINNVTGLSMEKDIVLIYKKHNRIYARACLNASSDETCRFLPIKLEEE